MLQQDNENKMKAEEFRLNEQREKKREYRAKQKQKNDG